VKAHCSLLLTRQKSDGLERVGLYLGIHRNALHAILHLNIWIFISWTGWGEKSTKDATILSNIRHVNMLRLESARFDSIMPRRFLGPRRLHKRVSRFFLFLRITTNKTLIFIHKLFLCHTDYLKKRPNISQKWHLEISKYGLYLHNFREINTQLLYRIHYNNKLNEKKSAVLLLYPWHWTSLKLNKTC